MESGSLYFEQFPGKAHDWFAHFQQQRLKHLQMRTLNSKAHTTSTRIFHFLEEKERRKKAEREGKEEKKMKRNRNRTYDFCERASV